MYITEQMIRDAERKYGVPETHKMSFDASERDIGVIRSSQKHGRKHDITLAIFGHPGVLVIAKPWYPKGLYRLPSGGLDPGESLEDGSAREAWEETGAQIELVRYHLRVDVDFVGESATIPWTTHLFSARYLSGEIAPNDTDEIREARWCALTEMLAHRELMLKPKVSGLHYRAALQDKFLEHLTALGWIRMSDGRIERLTSPISPT
jgi:8-oxo-dGTP pyrophosphatase MutT (NUDIX family)